MHSLEEHLIEGSILAAVIVFAFLANIRTTLISALAIPTSIISTFALMAAIGFDLNQITMLALTLMVGIVIDDAIIVLENIYRFMEEKGMPPIAAAIEGTQGNRPGRDGDHVLAAGRVPAHRLHGRHRRALHVVVRIHGVVRHRGVAAGVLHADADAELALRQGASQARGRSEAEAPRIRASSVSWMAITRAMLEWSMAHRKTMVAISVAVVLSTIPLFMLVGKNFHSR